MDDPVKIVVGKDKMSAYLTVRQNGSQDSLSAKDLKDGLQKVGIVFGIDHQVLEEIVEQKKWNETIQVATGKPVVRGEDGCVEYYFQTEGEGKPRIGDNGRADYHNLTLVDNVVVDQVLAKEFPPSGGVPGTDVFGKPIAPVKGRPQKLYAGKNTRYSDKSKTVLVSCVNGHVKLRHGGLVEVDTVFKVDHDVDFGTGDIVVNGDLQIHGDVKTGFKVQASGDIEIRGVVEDAEVTAGGDVIVKGGFVGQGKGIIKAGASVSLRFVHNQKVTAESDIEVGSEAIQADLIAGNSILINQGKSVLIGGCARAGKSITVDYVGNEQYAKTVVIVGDQEELEKELCRIEKELRENERDLARVRAKLAELRSIKRSKRWRPELQYVFRALGKLKDEIPFKSHRLEARREEIRAKFESIRNDAFVRVTRKIYPGVHFRVAGTSKKFEREWEGGVFRVLKGELVGLLDS